MSDLVQRVAKVVCTKLVRFEACEQNTPEHAPCSLKNCSVIPVASEIVAMMPSGVDEFALYDKDAYEADRKAGDA